MPSVEPSCVIFNLMRIGGISSSPVFTIETPFVVRLTLALSLTTGVGVGFGAVADGLEALHPMLTIAAMVNTLKSGSVFCVLCKFFIVCFYNF